MKIRVAIFNESSRSVEELISLLQNNEQLVFAGLCNDLQDCLKFSCHLAPNIMFMRLNDAFEEQALLTIRTLKSYLPDTDLVLDTSCRDEVYLLRTIVAGISGHLWDGSPDSLVEITKEVYLKGAALCPVTLRKVLQLVRLERLENTSPHPDYHLTCREKQILNFLVNGRSYKMICSDLNISYETVRSHMKKIYAKLNVSSLTEVVLKATSQRII